MASCLGLYIESNVIKYAKVTKDHDLLKVEAFGVKFYEKLGETLNQIVSETFSYNIPISINMSEEIYNYFFMFSLLNKNDLKKAIDTEFESYCFDKKLNKNAFETRYALCNVEEDRDKLKVIHVSSNKSSIAKILQTLNEFKVSTITPLGTSITNVASIKPKENIIIVNIAIIISIFGILGAIIGANISINMDVKVLKKAFGIFLAIIAIHEIYTIVKLYKNEKITNNKKR